MTIDSPDPLYQSNAAVLMSQPLKSSPASMLSSRYTACALGPPLMNSTRMLRPIAVDGTSSCSTGRLGLENPPAVADPPAKPTRPGNAAVAIAPTRSRHNQPIDFPTTIAIAAPPSVVAT